MSRSSDRGQRWEQRFGSFDVVEQAGRWDLATAGVVLARLGPRPGIRYFSPAEEAVARALCRRLLDLDDDQAERVVGLIDGRLAEDQTDGWRYDDMPEDGEAWRRSLAGLDGEAAATHGQGFASCASDEQEKLLQGIVDLGSGRWQGFLADRVWSLWTRYACTAFYALPAAWSEIGFPGPAYPRGYKNLGVGRTESFEAPDRIPDDDPARGRA